MLSILPATISATTIITVVSAVATVVAAIATIVAVVYARRTVNEATKGREEAAAAQDRQMAETKRATAAAAARHRAEVRERGHLALAQRRDRQVEQLERINDLLLRIVDVAREEERDPPQRLGAAITGSRLPAMLIRLNNAVAASWAFGAGQPEMARQLAQLGRAATTPPTQTLIDAIDALGEIEMLLARIGAEARTPAAAE